MPHTPISSICLEGRTFYVKRDDLIDPFLAGNKYRKLYALLQTPSSKLSKVISYGGTQSNAMLAIAALCKKKGWEFVYYSKPLSKEQKELSYGNYAHAIALGMQHREVENELYRDYIASLRVLEDPLTFILDQGGADLRAREGIECLAREIKEANLGVKSLATPAGTGTTALFLACALPEYKVYTTAAIGTSDYLKEQMLTLCPFLPENLVILETKKKYRFAKPYIEFYALYKKLLACGIEFDLLYAPLMWETLLEQTQEEILYIHSGGVSGNKTMLQRYAKVFTLSM
ncbi:MAG: 1-aminocyclopropane-1-carboxylate deaminase [Thiovulaceae bacterium]|nr:1-aminocyclopropane-1-carboxylate deaminase [Sulfurimonadaceae bacterium]